MLKNQLRKTTSKTTEYNFLFTFVSTFSKSIDFITFMWFGVKQIGTNTSGTELIPFMYLQAAKAWENSQCVCVSVFLQNCHHLVSYILWKVMGLSLCTIGVHVMDIPPTVSSNSFHRLANDYCNGQPFHVSISLKYFFRFCFVWQLGDQKEWMNHKW